MNGKTLTQRSESNMKRHILILAAILLAACSKTETSYEAPSEIAFTPVAEGMTKAAVEGVGYASNLPFNVFAQTTDSEAYFNNVKFEAGSETSGGLKVYEGNPTQYWPRTKNLKFAGYTGTSYPAATMNPGFTELTIAGYQQSADNDLMYFFDSGEGGNGYNTESGIVSPTMKHACSWITIKVTGQDACASWPIKQITVDGLSTSGKVVFNNNTPGVAWPILGATEDLIIFNTEATIETEPSAEAIVIPQTPVTLTVYYKDTSKSGISLQYNGTAEWEPGVHYTYTLNFLNPYKIDFSVDTVTPWDGTTPEITIQ